MVDHLRQTRRHRWGLGAFVLVEAVYLLTSVLVAFPFAGSDPAHVCVLLVIVGVPSILAAALAIVITLVRGNGPRTDLRLQWSWRAAGFGVMFGIAGLFVTIPVSLLWTQIVGEDANSAAGEVFGAARGTWGWAVAVFVLIAIVAPVCEEILYRGLLWDAVDQRWGRWVAFGVTTVVFSIAHLELTRTPLLLVVSIPIGLARLYADNLSASIVAHQVTNLLPGLVLMFTVAGVMPAV
ncbi:CPBP family intramembrane metalloprotease [Mycolicibacterium sp. BiH015]|uniref:CPBP family intramembrane glutamic endopeptidase n=1 Tax=Mycolicibacterium sp. BiH015 TaxID=3018808 RepID=UPI0022E80E69|nr:CPBP family intramembrane glutamic endopeptidase [Mycolicibacterium sp. BiH015]MDA2890672.1 CPBP family intramembrane metalloprotease [Mycolicibacterium sp. BiH015]